jgi:hypothetical protein
MKHQSAIVLSGTVAAIVAISLLGFNTLSATPFLVAENVKGPSAAASILGHVIYVVKDKDGNVKQYIQGDNAVTGAGHVCAAAYLFANTTSTVPGFRTCKAINGNGLHTETFQYIGIGNGTGGVFNGTENTLPTTAGFEVTPRSLSNPAVTLTSPANYQAMATITNSGAPFTFTELRASGTTLTSSGLFDVQNCNASGGCSAATQYGDMFADQAINVAVGSSDSLTVTWKITLN